MAGLCPANCTSPRTEGPPISSPDATKTLALVLNPNSGRHPPRLTEPFVASIYRSRAKQSGIWSREILLISISGLRRSGTTRTARDRESYKDSGLVLTVDRMTLGAARDRFHASLRPKDPSNRRQSGDELSLVPCTFTG